MFKALLQYGATNSTGYSRNQNFHVQALCENVED
jgi:hypothetical protein